MSAIVSHHVQREGRVPFADNVRDGGDDAVVVEAGRREGPITRAVRRTAGTAVLPTRRPPVEKSIGYRLARCRRPIALGSRYSSVPLNVLLFVRVRGVVCVSGCNLPPHYAETASAEPVLMSLLSS